MIPSDLQPTSFVYYDYVQREEAEPVGAVRNEIGWQEPAPTWAGTSGPASASLMHRA